MILVGSELSVVSGDTLWSFWSIGACGRQIPRALWRAVTVLCYSLLLVHTCIFVHEKKWKHKLWRNWESFSLSCVPSIAQRQSLVQGPISTLPCFPFEHFLLAACSLLPTHFGIAQRNQRSAGWSNGYPILIILWRPRRSIDWGSTGRWSWPWLFLASDSTWKSDIPSVRSKACWDGEGARADLTKLCRNSWGFRRFVFWSQEFLNMF